MVYRWLTNHGIQTRNRSESQEEYGHVLTRKVLQQLYIDEQKPTVVISKILGCGISTVNRYLQKHNIALRDGRLENLPIGTTFNQWTTIGNVYYDKGCAKVLCRCTCGIVSTLKSSELLRNQKIQCQQCYNDNRPSGNKSLIFKGYKQISGKWFMRCKANAKARRTQGIDFFSSMDRQSTLEYIWSLYDTQNKTCPLSGLELTWKESETYDSNGTVSLDRIVNTLSYTPENTWLIHKTVNVMKWKFSVKQLIQYCTYITQKRIVTHVWDKTPKLSMKHNHSWKGCGDINGVWLCSISQKTTRDKRLLDCTITTQDLWNKLVSQNYQCALTNETLQISYNKRGKPITTASVDRIDSLKGYTVDNIQWLHKDINQMKFNLPQDEFIHWCKLITEHTSTPEWQEKYGHLLTQE